LQKTYDQPARGFRAATTLGHLAGRVVSTENGAEVAAA
jgi:hypothetical protein